MTTRGPEPGARSTLAALFPSRAMARLVVFFAIHPDDRFPLRELARRTRLSRAALQRELRSLTRMGAVERREDGGRALFAADEEHDAWRAWRLLLRSAAAPHDVLREALAAAEGVEAAFVFGSTARGDRRRGSDVDLFVLVSGEEPEGRRRDFRRQLSEVESLLGRPLDVVEYTAEKARARSRAGHPFLRRILAEPRAWVRGDEPAFLRLVEDA